MVFAHDQLEAQVRLSQRRRQRESLLWVCGGGPPAERKRRRRGKDIVTTYAHRESQPSSRPRACPARARLRSYPSLRFLSHVNALCNPRMRHQLQPESEQVRLAVLQTSDLTTDVCPFRLCDALAP